MKFLAHWALGSRDCVSLVPMLLEICAAVGYQCRRISGSRRFEHAVLAASQARRSAPLIRQRTALLIGRWRRWTAATAQCLAERISAKLRIITLSQPLRRLRYACAKKLRVLTARATAVCAVMGKKFVADLGSPPVAPTRRATGRRHPNQE